MQANHNSASAKWLFFKISLFLIIVAQAGFAQTVQRLKFSTITASKNTGVDYSPWLSDDVNNLVQASWQANNSAYVNVTLALATPGKITQLSLYDGQGVFVVNPAYVYAIKGTKKTLLATFTGPGYLTWENHSFKTPVDADAIMVRKYGNNIPQKIFVYGTPTAPPVVTPTPPVVVPPVVTPTPPIVVVPPVVTPTPPVVVVPPVVTPPVVADTIVKIPIIAKRWYQLNNVNDGLEALTDGVTDVAVNTGYGKVILNFDAFYPVADGEKITLSQVKFFSYQGGLDQPLTLSIINSKGKRINVATFKGFAYNSWVGPYPDRALTGDAQFNLDSTYTDIKYLVINSNGVYPTEMELYGTYKAPPAATAPITKPTKLKQFFGANAFEWNFETGELDPTKVDSSKTRAINSFTQIRHYMDWSKLEWQKGSYTFNPTHDGGWSYDAMYQYCKNHGMEVLADMKQQPPWMVATWPDSLQDSQNVPVVYGADFADPNSYIDQAKMAFQYVARYGTNNTVDTTLLSVNNTQRWTGDPVNVIKRGMGLIKYIECDNERDKWWKGRKGYQTAYEYAANMSAFYDGNKNTMGPGVGAKNADANVQVVMAGLSSADPSYVRGMIEWCRQNRGYKADGSVNLCWDIINYHLYSSDSDGIPNAFPTVGRAPEVDLQTAKTAQAFVQMAHDLAGDMPVWVTEVGYDVNQGSPYRVIPIGNKPVLEVQADWSLRTSLLYARNGINRIFFYEMYDDNGANPTQYASSGLINDDRTRRPVADYLYQTNKLLGEYTFQKTLNSDPIVDQYLLNGNPAYVMVVPDEKGRTADYSLDLPGVDSVKLYTPKIGADSMTMQYVKTVGGKLKITVTETPQFVIPIMGATMATQSLNTLNTDVALNKPVPISITKPEANNLKLYPNPSQGYVNVAFNSVDVKNAITIRVLNEQNGTVYSKFTDFKETQDYSKLVDLSAAAIGIYVIEVKQGTTTMLKKLIKVN